MIIYNVIQHSIVDGEHLVNAVPCADEHSARAIMDEEIRTLLNEGKYAGLDLDEIERCQNDDDADCDYALERRNNFFYIDCIYDDYSERIEIEEKPLMTIG